MLSKQLGPPLRHLLNIFFSKFTSFCAHYLKGEI